MYAIIETGGKQFRVEEGRTLKLHRMDVQAGETITVDSVLLVDTGKEVKIGQPYVDKAQVCCEVVDHGREKKIIVFHKRRRKDSAKKQGHRQDFTTVKVTSISA